MASTEHASTHKPQPMQVLPSFSRWGNYDGSKFLGKPYEPNAIIKNDMEFILMQRKPGGYRKPTEAQRDASRISNECSAKAVALYGETLADQRRRRKGADQGSCSAVTGGAQMDGFNDLFSKAIARAGIPGVFHLQEKGGRRAAGSFRTTMEWDLLVIRDLRLRGFRKGTLCSLPPTAG